MKNSLPSTMQEQIARKRELRRRLAALRDTCSGAHMRLTASRNELVGLQARLNSAKPNADYPPTSPLRREYEALLADAAQQEATVARDRADLDRLESEIDELQGEHSRLNTTELNFETAVDDYHESVSSIAAVEARMEALQQRLPEIHGQMRELQAQTDGWARAQADALDPAAMAQASEGLNSVREELQRCQMLKANIEAQMVRASDQLHQETLKQRNAEQAVWRFRFENLLGEFKASQRAKLHELWVAAALCNQDLPSHLGECAGLRPDPQSLKAERQWLLDTLLSAQQ